VVSIISDWRGPFHPEPADEPPTDDVLPPE
jgi:hypothetical protein